MTALALTNLEKLRAENAHLRAALRANTELVLCYRSDDGDPVPSTTYVQAGLVALLAQERETRRAVEAELAAVLRELRAALHDDTQHDAARAAHLTRLTLEQLQRELRKRAEQPCE